MLGTCTLLCTGAAPSERVLWCPGGTLKGARVEPFNNGGSGLKVVYKNNDVRLELSRLAKQGDPKMKVGPSALLTCY